MTWQEAIQHWRNLPEAEKHRIRWERIPLNVAQSMAFAGEPVDLAALEAAHKLLAPPPSDLTTSSSPQRTDNS